MIALITSCINPTIPGNSQIKSFFDPKERLEQTCKTIDALGQYPIDKIYLLDNSYNFDYSLLINSINKHIEIIPFRQYQFDNKGINELLMILSIVDDLPDNEIILKISGRYYPNQQFTCSMADNVDFKIKSFKINTKSGTISTRGYFAANKRVYKEFLLKWLSEVFIYPYRVVGFRSGMKALKQIFYPTASGTNFTSIEYAGARVLKLEQYRVEYVENIGIEGIIAGFEQKDFISE